jgi:hypothetical protein
MLKYLEKILFSILLQLFCYTAKKNKSRQTFRILAHWKFSGNMFKKIHHILASHENKKYINL